MLPINDSPTFHLITPTCPAIALITRVFLPPRVALELSATRIEPSFAYRELGAVEGTNVWGCSEVRRANETTSVSERPRSPTGQFYGDLLAAREHGRLRSFKRKGHERARGFTSSEITPFPIVIHFNRGPALGTRTSTGSMPWRDIRAARINLNEKLAEEITPRCIKH